MSHVADCVHLLPDFCSAVCQNDWGAAKTKRGQISQIEGTADELKQQIRLQMPNNLFMPVSRADLLELISDQDSIANMVKDVAGIMLGRKLIIPTPVQDSFTGFVNACVAAVDKAKTAVDELDDLLETGFRGVEVRLVKKLILELDQLERETDEIQVHVRAELFAIEKTLNPIDAVFLYQVLYKVGSIADCAQRVGHRLQLLIAS